MYPYCPLPIVCAYANSFLSQQLLNGRMSRSRCQDTVKHVRILIRGGRPRELPDIESNSEAGRAVRVEDF